MAVPKKKTSHSRKRNRSSGKFLDAINVLDKNSTPRIGHRIDVNGFYKGVCYKKQKVKNNNEQEVQQN